MLRQLAILALSERAGVASRVLRQSEGARHPTCTGGSSLRAAGSAAQHVLVAGFLLPTFSLDGRPLFVRRLVSAGDDVGEILRCSRAFLKVGHVIGKWMEDVVEVYSAEIAFSANRDIGEERGVSGALVVFFGGSSVAAQVCNAFKLLWVDAV